MSTDEYGRLIGQLRTWCKAEHGRQKVLASQLKVSPQLVNDWLSGHRTVSLDEWIQLEAIIEQSAGTQFPKDKPMTLFVPKTDRPPAVHDPSSPRSLAEARERIEALSSELALLKSGAPAVATGPTQPPSPPVPDPAAALPTTDLPITVPKAAPAPSSPTLTPTPATRPSAHLAFTLVSQSAFTPISHSAKPRCTPFPAGCDSLKAIEAYLENLSPSELRSHQRGFTAGPPSAKTFEGELDQLQQRLLDRELQRRR